MDDMLYIWFFFITLYCTPLITLYAIIHLNCFFYGPNLCCIQILNKPSIRSTDYAFQRQAPFEVSL